MGRSTRNLLTTLERAGRLLVGDRPRALLALTLPTGLALAVDLMLRARALAGYALQGKAIYASSWLVSAAFWALPLWAASRLMARGTRVARALLALLSVLWLLPFATLAYAGQILYHRVFHAYMGRDTLRLGIALRGTVTDWFGAWGGPWLAAAMLLIGLLATAVMLRVARGVAPVGARVPWLLVVTFVASIAIFWTDQVDSRFLQAALPDACFVHGVVHAARMAITGQWKRRQGVSVRTPARLPPLVSRSSGRPPNVVVILTESVRADASCSDPPPACASPELDPFISDRAALGRLTSQTPNTFSASVILWTGLPPNADFRTAHSAPVLWEIARAAGYRTAYVSAQNPEYEDFGVFTERAGIDVLVTAVDLGGMAQEQVGAPDERATERALRFAREVPTDRPYFLVVHLSNTHAPYRIDPGILPFTPVSAVPLGNVEPFHNRYRDAVRLQERTVAGLLEGLEALPTWEDTAVVFLSDHGEQFREHGGLYHNHSLFDEEVRIPGWIAGGKQALDPSRRAALATYAGKRTYTQDVHETIVDLFGLEEERAILPYAPLVTGRSLLRPWHGEPTMLLATSTAVWEPDDARFGVMRGDHALLGASTGAWRCFDVARDPLEKAPGPASGCGDLLDVARRAFADVADPH